MFSVANLGEEVRIPETRPRRAWYAADLDKLIDEAALRDVKNDFWRQYKLRHPAEVTYAIGLARQSLPLRDEPPTPHGVRRVDVPEP